MRVWMEGEPMTPDDYPAAFARLVAKVDELRAENAELRRRLDERPEKVMRRPKGAETRTRDRESAWEPGPCRPGTIL